MFIMHEESQTGTIDLADGTPKDIKQHVWIDTWVNKEYTRPDVLEFTFNAEGTTEKLADGKIVFSYLQFYQTAGDANAKTTIACVNTLGSPEEAQIVQYEGSTDWSDNTVQG